MLSLSIACEYIRVINIAFCVTHGLVQVVVLLEMEFEALGPSMPPQMERWRGNDVNEGLHSVLRGISNWFHSHNILTMKIMIELIVLIKFKYSCDTGSIMMVKSASRHAILSMLHKRCWRWTAYLGTTFNVPLIETQSSSVFREDCWGLTDMNGADQESAKLVDPWPYVKNVDCNSSVEVLCHGVCGPQRLEDCIPKNNIANNN